MRFLKGFMNYVMAVSTTKDTEFKRLLAYADDAYEQKDYIKATELLNNALSIFSDSKETALIHIKIGTVCYLREQAGEAKKNYFFALKKLENLSDDDSQEITSLIHHYLGTIFLEDGDYEKTLEHKLKAFEHINYFHSEEAFMILAEIGFSYEKLNNYDKATEFYLRAAELPPVSDEDTIMISESLGQCYDKKGDEKSAFDWYHKIFSKDKNYDGGWHLTYRYGELAYRFRQYELSLYYLGKTENQIPSDQKNCLQHLYLLSGYNYLAQKKYKNAVNELNKAMKIRSDSSEMMAYIYCSTAQAYFGLDKIRKTVRFGLKALHEEADSVTKERVYFLLAYSYFFKSNEEKAKKYYDKLRDVNPKSAYLRELWELGTYFR